MIARTLGDRRGEGYALRHLASYFKGIGKPEQALELSVEIGQIAAEIDDLRLRLITLNNTAELFRELGDIENAERNYREALQLSKKIDHYGNAALVSSNLARLMIAAGKYADACECLAESLQFVETFGHKGLALHLLEIGSCLAAATGDPVAAARLSGAALKRIDDSGTMRESVDEAFIAPLIARAREALGALVFDEAERNGRTLSDATVFAELRLVLNNLHQEDFH